MGVWAAEYKCTCLIVPSPFRTSPLNTQFRVPTVLKYFCLIQPSLFRRCFFRAQRRIIQWICQSILLNVALLTT